MKFFFSFISIIFTALIIDIITVELLGWVVQALFNIPENEMLHLIYWGDSFISRIILSLIGTLIGGYIIGASLSKKQKLATFIYSFPIIIFWLVGLVGYYYIASLPNNLDNPEFHMFSSKKLIPLIILIFTLPIAYLGNYYGVLHNKYYNRTYSILNIKWYNLIWFIPAIYQFAIPVIVMLVLTIFYSLWIGDNPLLSSFQMLSDNILLIEIISLLSLSIILISALKIFKSTYKYLSFEDSELKYRFWKIFGAIIYFWMLFVFMFNLPSIISFQFDSQTLVERFEAVPKNINDLVNFSLIMFSGYISQKPVIAVLKTNPIFKIIFEKLKIFRLILLHKILKK